MDRMHEWSRSFSRDGPLFSAPPPCLLCFPPSHSVLLPNKTQRNRNGEEGGAAEGGGGGGVVRGAAAEAGGGEQAQARGAPAPPPLRRRQRSRHRGRQALAGGSQLLGRWRGCFLRGSIYPLFSSGFTLPQSAFLLQAKKRKARVLRDATAEPLRRSGRVANLPDKPKYREVGVQESYARPKISSFFPIPLRRNHGSGPKLVLERIFDVCVCFFCVRAGGSGFREEG
jgi:hypothetical protein